MGVAYRCENPGHPQTAGPCPPCEQEERFDRWQALVLGGLLLVVVLALLLFPVVS